MLFIHSSHVIFYYLSLFYKFLDFLKCHLGQKSNNDAVDNNSARKVYSYHCYKFCQATVVDALGTVFGLQCIVFS